MLRRVVIGVAIALVAGRFIAPLLFRDSGHEPEFRRLTIAERLPVFQGRFPLLLRADAQPSVRLLVSEEAAN